MTTTVDDVLGTVFNLIVAVAAAVTALASAIVGLWLLRYLANVLSAVMKKSPRI